MPLKPRETAVLTLVVEDYIERAAPVGSRAVAEKSGMKLSPASMRNVMAELKDQGYLEQPHTSAGAVPSAMGFRYYLDMLLTVRTLNADEREAISGALGAAGHEVDEILKRASRLLSSISSNVSMVLAPVPDSARWKHIDFIAVGPELIMAILVLQGGIVQKRVVRSKERFTSDELVSFGNYLNELFANMTVQEAQAHILQELKPACDIINTLSARALNLAMAAMESGEDRELYLDGASRIFAQPEFADVQSMRDLLAFLEDRTRLLDLLGRTARESGVTVTLGRESEMAEIKDCGLVHSTYRVGDEPAGVVGVIGPLRMDYSTVVPVVDFTARMLTSLFMHRF